jgi:uncharacterized protein (TIGR00661 family)
MNICCYITSHGFGHATRTFGTLKELIKKDLNIIIRADLPDWLVNKSFNSSKVSYKKGFETFKVFHYPDPLTFDLSNTFAFLNTYFSKYEKIIDKEVTFCNENRIDLIISDIEPSAFEVAHKCRIPSIGISNFTWFDIYKEILPADNKLLSRIKSAYNMADCLMKLPFHFNMEYFRKIIDVPLVFRKLTRSENQIRSQLKLELDEKIILIQFGGHNFNQIENWAKSLDNYVKNNPKTHFITNRFSNFSASKSLHEKIFKIPPEDIETQDYLNISDLVVGKTGYSTVSEVIGFQVPFFYSMREMWTEDLILKKGLEQYGLGKYFEKNDFLNGNWIEKISEGMELKESEPKNKIEKYGQDFIADYILKKY